MISAAVTVVFICLLFISGKIFESIKRLLQLFFSLFLKLLNVMGIKISIREPRIKVSKQFKETFKDIRIVKKSKKNEKIKPSINIIALALFLSAVALIIINLDIVSGNVVTNWLYANNPLPFLVTNPENMNVTFTAFMFSTVSFSLSKLLSQWKETSKYRKAKKDMKIKKYAVDIMTSKELLDHLREKDQQHYIEHKDIREEDKK